MVVVIVGECCEVPTGFRAPPRLELTLFTHHAQFDTTQCNTAHHHPTQHNATPPTTAQHPSLQPNVGPHNLTQPTAPQSNASPHKSPQSPSSSSCSPHPYPTERGWQPCAPPWLGRVLMVLSLGSLEHPEHPPSMGALAGALCGCGGM